MLIYSDCTTNMNKNTRRSDTQSIRKPILEVKTSKRQKNLSKKNINFLLSLGLNLKKK